MATAFVNVLGLLRSGKRRKFEVEFNNIRKLQFKGGEKAKVELCNLIQLVLATDGRFSTILITDLYNLLTDSSKKVSLAALDTLSLYIDTILHSVIQGYSHKDKVPDTGYIPGGAKTFSTILADYECLRSTFESLLKSTKSEEVSLHIFKILASELQIFADVDISDYISYYNNKHFNSSTFKSQSKCNCFASARSCTFSYGDLKPVMLSKCARNSDIQEYLLKWRDNNVKLLTTYMKKDLKSDISRKKYLLALHVASLLISAYPLTYNPLLSELKQLDANEDRYKEFVFKQLVRILSSNAAIFLHREIVEYLHSCGYSLNLESIYREIRCSGSTILYSKSPLNFEKTYRISCNIADFGGAQRPYQHTQAIDSNVVERRGPLYYLSKPERIDIVSYLAASKPHTQLVDMALTCDVTKDADFETRVDTSSLVGIPACKVLYYTPSILKFELSDPNEDGEGKQEIFNEHVLNDDRLEITPIAQETVDANLFKIVANQVLTNGLNSRSIGLAQIKRRLLNKILFDDTYLQPDVSRDILKLYFAYLTSNLSLDRYAKISPDTTILQNALNEWNDYFNCVTDMLYHKSVLDYLKPSEKVKEEFVDRITYDDLLLMCFDGIYSEKVLSNRSFRDHYIKSICSFFLSIPYLPDCMLNRFYSLLDGLGGSLLVFSLISNLLKKSRSKSLKLSLFSLFLKALYHKNPTVRNLFGKLIESPRGLYLVPQSKEFKYSQKAFEELHMALSERLAPVLTGTCRKCDKLIVLGDAFNKDIALSLPIWQWPPSLISLLQTNDTSLRCSCGKDVVKVDSKLLFWKRDLKEQEFDWQNPEYIHYIWLQEVVFSTLFSAPGESTLPLKNLLTPSSLVKKIYSDLTKTFDFEDSELINISINTASLVCGRSPELLSTLIYAIDLYIKGKRESSEPCSGIGKVCTILNENVINTIVNLSSKFIGQFLVFLKNYITTGIATCLIKHITGGISNLWNDPSYNIVDKLDLDSPEMLLISCCRENDELMVPIIQFLPSTIAIDLITRLFFSENNEEIIERCIENILSLPTELFIQADKILSETGREWLSPERLLITLYKFDSPEVDVKKQARLLDYLISLAETNQKRPSNVPKNIFISLHSLVKSCAIIVEEKDPLLLIFGRLLCQIVHNVPSVRGGLVQHVMPLLVERKTWEDKQLWKGVVMSFGILWPEFKEQLILLIFKLPQAIGENLLASIQQRHPVIPDIAAIVSKKQHLRAICPRYITSILGL